MRLAVGGTSSLECKTPLKIPGMLSVDVQRSLTCDLELPRGRETLFMDRKARDARARKVFERFNCGSWLVGDGGTWSV